MAGMACARVCRLLQDALDEFATKQRNRTNLYKVLDRAMEIRREGSKAARVKLVKTAVTTYMHGMAKALLSSVSTCLPSTVLLYHCHCTFVSARPLNP
jgi:hypothetical protein